MKKKLLAVLLCMTICVVGLPFTANAAETIGDEIIHLHIKAVTRSTRTCNCDATQYLVNYPVRWSIIDYYGTKDKCHKRYYAVVRVQCGGCNQLYDDYDVYETITSHTYASNGQCNVCGYWRASKSS